MSQFILSEFVEMLTVKTVMQALELEKCGIFCAFAL